MVAAIVCHLLLLSFVAVEAAPDPRRTPVVQAVEKVLPSVVNVSVERRATSSTVPAFDPYGSAFERFFGSESEGNWSPATSALGSGVVLDADGLILTTAHMVAEAATVTVTLADGSSFAAETVALSRRDDLALLRLRTLPPSGTLRAIAFEQPDDLLLGETVITVGNPFGLGHSVGVGVLSARKRRVSANDREVLEDVLQTDAPINPGNSGGPLVNARGNLIGINLAIESNAERIGFAIPVRRLEEVVTSWLIPSRFSRGNLGVIPESVLRDGKPVGVRIGQVVPDSPAGAAGLVAGAIIRAVDGKPVKRTLTVGRALWRKQPGDKVTLRLEGGSTVEVVVGQLQELGAPELAAKWLGLELKELSPRIANALGLQQLRGMVVAGVEGDAERRDGLQRGDVITRIDDHAVATMADVRKALQNVRHGDVVSVAVHRAAGANGATRFSGFVLDIAL